MISQPSYLLLKRCPESLLRIVHKVFNLLYHHINIFPEKWKITRTILIPKKNSPEMESDWRLITLQSTFYKTYSTILNKRLLRFLLSNKLISDAQNGFLPIEGCINQTLLLKAAINDAKAYSKSVYLLQIPIKMQKFVSKHLDGCKFSLAFNGFESEPITANAGVAQGDSNSPTEYLLFQEQAFIAGLKQIARYTILAPSQKMAKASS